MIEAMKFWFAKELVNFLMIAGIFVAVFLMICIVATAGHIRDLLRRK